MNIRIREFTSWPVARRSALALVAVTLLALAPAGCDSQAAPAGPPPPQVSVAEVLSQPVSLWDEYSGRVSAVESVELRPRVTGYIEKVAFDEGELVEKDDLLFVIDSRRYQAELDRAEAELASARSQAKLARKQLARAEQLVEAKAVSRGQYETRRAATAQADAAVQAADAAVASARLDMQFTHVRAPISGVVGRAMLTAGNLAEADSTLLTTLVSLDPVHVDFAIDEQSALRYGKLNRNGQRDRTGMPVRVGLASESGYPHAGTVDFIDNHVDPDTGTLHARAVLPNPGHVLKPGLFARVQLQGATREQALLIDDKAVLTDQDRKYVYVLGEGNKAVRRDVVLGPRADGLRVVASGLAAGDKVIVRGVQKVFFPGMPVAPELVAMGAAPATPTVASVAGAQ